MGINYKRLDEAIDFGLQNPDQFNMDAWIFEKEAGSCGTVACLAGTVVMMNGWEPAGRHGYIGNRKSWSFVSKGPDYAPVGRVAAELLGLDPGDFIESNLFYLDDIYQVITVRNELAMRDDVEPNYFGLEHNKLGEVIRP